MAGKANTPQKVEGEVLKVDHGLDKVTVKGKDGMVHEFQVSKDTLRDRTHTPVTRTTADR